MTKLTKPIQKIIPLEVTNTAYNNNSNNLNEEIDTDNDIGITNISCGTDEAVSVSPVQSTFEKIDCRPRRRLQEQVN